MGAVGRVVVGKGGMCEGKGRGGLERYTHNPKPQITQKNSVPHTETINYWYTSKLRHSSISSICYSPMAAAYGSPPSWSREQW